MQQQSSEVSPPKSKMHPNTLARLDLYKTLYLKLHDQDRIRHDDAMKIVCKKYRVSSQTVWRALKCPFI